MQSHVYTLLYNKPDALLAFPILKVMLSLTWRDLSMPFITQQWLDFQNSTFKQTLSEKSTKQKCNGAHRMDRRHCSWHSMKQDLQRFCTLVNVWTSTFLIPNTQFYQWSACMWCLTKSTLTLAKRKKKPSESLNLVHPGFSLSFSKLALTWNRLAPLQRQPGVGVGPHKKAAFLVQVLHGSVQLHVAEVLVEAYNHCLHLRVQGDVGPVRLLAGDQVRSDPYLVDPHRLEFLLHGVAPHQVDFTLQLTHGLEVHGAAVRGAEHLLLFHAEAQRWHLVSVHAPGLGAVVGDEEHPLAVLLEQLYDTRRAGDGLVPPPDDPVAVEKDAVHRVQQLLRQRATKPATLWPSHDGGVALKCSVTTRWSFTVSACARRSVNTSSNHRRSRASPVSS